MTFPRTYAAARRNTLKTFYIFDSPWAGGLRRWERKDYRLGVPGWVDPYLTRKEPHSQRGR